MAPESLTPDLSDSSSPFLQHGATQPVNWLAWSDSAFERARRENRPVLLDIGAVWCHWCHVMDWESYEDPETARLINELYIPIKVDRDERPDIDARYQRAVQALTGHGGWPLTAFLTPTGEVFYGGTYFPPEDGLGRPAFRRVLTEIARVWQDDEPRAVEAARAIGSQLSALAWEDAEVGAVSAELVDTGIEAFDKSFDRRFGGFGWAPKFPNAGALQLLLDHVLDTGEESARQIVTETLTAMARGGIHDQLGGGFHRYSVDNRWIVPHFEKMAYDNGPLLEVYARAGAALGEPLYLRVAEGIVAYYKELAPELAAGGGYPASQDADLGPQDDGSHWTWTPGEVEAALGGDERLIHVATLRYGLDDPAGGLHSSPDRHVLYLAAEAPVIAEELGIAQAEAESLMGEVAGRLKAVREERPRPFVDESRYSGWVALVASGHIAAARYLELEGAGESALRALDRIWDEAFDLEDGVAHRIGDRGSGGYLEDQAYFAQALLDAFEWTGRGEYLERARQVAEVMVRRHSAIESSALSDRPAADPAPVGLLAEPHLPIVDAPAPSGNGVAALVLLRLAVLVDEAGYRQRALEVLGTFAGLARREPTAVATYLRAVDWATRPITTVVVVGAEDDETAVALHRTALRTARPRLAIRYLTPASLDETSLPAALRAMVTATTPRAYLCVGESCAEPVSAPKALEELLARFRG